VIENYIDNNNITHIYRYGSQVYGTNHANSDDDYVFITKEKINIPDDNISTFTLDEFVEGVAKCNIACLESYFQNRTSGNILKHDFYLPDIEIDQEVLRRSISAIASNAWAKCKKKLTVEKDYNEYVALKSLFHSLRILDYGIQIATFGYIHAYDSMNFLYYDLFQMSKLYKKAELWQKIDEKYKPLRNQKHSKFKLMCPFKDN
jgi:hypothetical protein